MSLNTATFGMGCFWSPQKQFSGVTGVKKTYVGYTGGENKSPTYKTVCDGDGHIEAVRVLYEDTEISYEELLDIFWMQDFESMAKQNGQYASRIWVHNDYQRQCAQLRVAQLSDVSDPRAKFPVISESMRFYKAEGYHQNYWSKQTPRLALLICAFIIDLSPNLDPIIYKIGLGLTISFVIITLFEKMIDNKVSVYEDI